MGTAAPWRRRCARSCPRRGWSAGPRTLRPASLCWDLCARNRGRRQTTAPTGFPFIRPKLAVPGPQQRRARTASASITRTALPGRQQRRRLGTLDTHHAVVTRGRACVAHAAPTRLSFLSVAARDGRISLSWGTCRTWPATAASARPRRTHGAHAGSGPSLAFVSAARVSAGKGAAHEAALEAARAGLGSPRWRA